MSFVQWDVIRETDKLAGPSDLILQCILLSKTTLRTNQEIAVHGEPETLANRL